MGVGSRGAYSKTFGLFFTIKRLLMPPGLPASGAMDRADRAVRPQGRLCPARFMRRPGSIDCLYRTSRHRFAQAFALIWQRHAFVGFDSGMAHAAAAFSKSKRGTLGCRVQSDARGKEKKLDSLLLLSRRGYPSNTNIIILGEKNHEALDVISTFSTRSSENRSHCHSTTRKNRRSRHGCRSLLFDGKSGSRTTLLSPGEMGQLRPGQLGYSFRRVEKPQNGTHSSIDAYVFGEQHEDSTQHCSLQCEYLESILDLSTSTNRSITCSSATNGSSGFKERLHFRATDSSPADFRFSRMPPPDCGNKAIRIAPCYLSWSWKIGQGDKVYSAG